MHHHHNLFHDTSRCWRLVSGEEFLCHRLLPRLGALLAVRYRSILAQSESHHYKETACYGFFLIDGASLSFSIDKDSCKKSYMHDGGVAARTLNNPQPLVRGGDPRYWNWVLASDYTSAGI
ncbi:hypothetical protein Ancab_009983 [Ancistrocladus abbreviatus]